MMVVVTSYTLDASAKTITLGSDFSSITIEQILDIKNITKNVEIYNSEDPKKRRLSNQEDGIDISLADGVITYIETASMDNADKILITIDLDQNTSPYTANLFSAESVAASGTATCEASISTGKLSKMSVYVANAGTSTNCTVTIWGSPTSSLTGRKKALAVFTIGASSEAGNGIDLSQIDNYTWASIANGDAANAAEITVTLSMFR